MDPGFQKTDPTAPPDYSDALRSAPDMYNQAPSNFQGELNSKKLIIVFIHKLKINL